MSDKDSLRAQIAGQVASFLNSGGRIQALPGFGATPHRQETNWHALEAARCQHRKTQRKN